MISNGTRHRGFVFVPIAAIALLGLGTWQQGRPLSDSSGTKQTPVYSEPVRSDQSCTESADAVAAMLRSEGFAAQAVRNFSRENEQNCPVPLDGPAPATVQTPGCLSQSDAVATDLRSIGFSAQAAKNFAETDC